MKGKKLLMSALTLSMIGSSIGGGCLIAAAATGPQPRTGPTVGEFVSWDGHTFRGSSETEAENKTIITYAGGGNWARTLVYITGTTAESEIVLSLTPDAEANLQLTAFDYAVSTQGANLIESTTMAANEAFTRTVSVADSGLEDKTSLCLAFYFDAGLTTDTKHITVNTLTVDGVSYTPAAYEPPQAEVPAPEHPFKGYTEWVATNGTISANTLDKMTEGDEGYATAVDEGAGNFTITDLSAPAALEIPLSEPITDWPTAWSNMHVKFKATNITQINAYFESEAVESGRDDEPADNHGFAFGLLGAWNVTTVNSVTEGYKLSSLQISGMAGDFLNGHDIFSPEDWVTVIGHANGHDAITKIVLVPVVKEGATEASIEIGGMTFGGATAPTFINDIGTPELEIGEWLTWGQHTIEQEGSLEAEDKTYTGVKVSYTAENVAPGIETSFHVQIGNFDAAKSPKLHLGFYTDSEITLAIGADWSPLTDHVVYGKGYHEVEVDFSKQTANSFLLRLWTNTNTTDFEGTKTIVIDSITFYKDVEIAIGDATKDGLFQNPTVTDGKLILTWDAKDAGAYYRVAVPVDNWHSFDRVLHMNITLSHETKLGIWGTGDTFTDQTLKNTHTVLAAGTYDFYLSTSTAGLIEGGINNILIYCDVANTAESSIVKTLTVNKFEFLKGSSVVSSPNASAVTVNYLEQKVTFDAAYEVSATADFATKLESGAVVTPGTTLYVRLADGSSAATAIALPVTALSEDTAPEATVGENYIRFGAAGYEYKLGEDGEWTTLGSWGNLTADTEYTVYVRICATESSFASETVQLKIKTTASSGTNPNPTPSEPDEKKGGCGSSILGYGSVGIVAAATVALGTVMIVRRKKD